MRHFLNAGDRNTRISITRRNPQLNSFGETDDNFAAIGSVWASVEYVPDGERLSAGSLESNISIRTRVESSVFSKSFTTEDRVIIHGKTYSVVGIKPLNNNRGFELSLVGEVRA